METLSVTALRASVVMALAHRIVEQSIRPAERDPSAPGAAVDHEEGDARTT